VQQEKQHDPQRLEGKPLHLTVKVERVPLNALEIHRAATARHAVPSGLSLPGQGASRSTCMAKWIG
jgi:hypothetical protein